MFSLLAIKARISPPAPLPEFSPPSLMSHHLDCFLPSREDMKVILSDMEVLVVRLREGPASAEEVCCPSHSTHLQ